MEQNNQNTQNNQQNTQSAFTPIKRATRSNSSLPGQQQHNFFKNYRAVNSSNSNINSSQSPRLLDQKEQSTEELKPRSMSSASEPTPVRQIQSPQQSQTPQTPKQQQNQVEIKYHSQKAGQLITSGDVIFQQNKKFENDSNSTTIKESEEEFFRKIDEREMTDKDKSHYKRVVEEYYQTEKTHIEGLQLLKKVYLNTIADNCNKNDIPFLNEVRSQVDVIISIHTNFLQMFEESYRNTKKDESSIFENGITLYWKL